MIGLFHFVLAILASPFKSKLRLEAENAMLRHQLMVLRRRVRGRVRLTTMIAGVLSSCIMVKRRGPPSQGWKTFLRNHAPDIAAMDLFVVPTIGFKLLYGFVIVRIDRRDLVWIDVTLGLRGREMEKAGITSGLFASFRLLRCSRTASGCGVCERCSGAQSPLVRFGDPL
jgi:hypothetical protein